jgi:hypothetical protein
MPDETPPASTPATPAAQTVAATPPPANASGTTTPATPATPSTVTISTEAYTALADLKIQIAELRSQQQQREDTARAEQLALMAKNGEAEKALQETRKDAERQLHAERTQSAANKARAERYALDNELTRVLAEKPLNPGAAVQLVQLLRGNFSVEPQGETFAVRTPAGQSVADFVAAQLAHADYAHFIRSGNQGGTGGTTGGHQSTPTPPANTGTTPVVPNTLSEAVILHYQGIEAKRPTDSRIDLSQPMGLRRTAK